MSGLDSRCFELLVLWYRYLSGFAGIVEVWLSEDGDGIVLALMINV
jgi:hypothetical protein